MHLPLFPLRTVLFPDGALPLQIFEVRYLDMISRQHLLGEPFGIVALLAGDEVRRPPTGAPSGEAFSDERFYPIGTLAHIERLERPGPGLLMIRCAGGQRFRLLGEVKQAFGLWSADVELLEGDASRPVPEDLTFVRDSLQHLMRQLDRELGPDVSIEEIWPREPHRWDDCGWLANRWCEVLPFDLPAKQRLMALESPVVRLELVADMLNEVGSPEVR